MLTTLGQTNISDLTSLKTASSSKIFYWMKYNDCIMMLHWRVTRKALFVFKPMGARFITNRSMSLMTRRDPIRATGIDGQDVFRAAREHSLSWYIQSDQLLVNACVISGREGTTSYCLVRLKNYSELPWIVEPNIFFYENIRGRD